MARERSESTFGRAETLPGARPCPACGNLTIHSTCEHCGYDLEWNASSNHESWPKVGARYDDGERPITLTAPVASRTGTRRFLAVDETGGRYEVLVTERSDPAGVVSSRAHAATRLGASALNPAWSFDNSGLRFIVTRLPDASSVAEGLAGLLAAGESVDVLASVRRWAHPVAAFLARLHGEGYFIGGADPAELLVHANGEVYVRDAVSVHAFDDAPLPAGPRMAVRGFSAPEVFGHCGGRVGPSADVFFGGMVLFYAIARIAPLAEAAVASYRLPSPHVYAPNAPPELIAVARRATSPLPARRYPDARAFFDALKWAIDLTERRRRTGYQRLRVDIGHELHIGVLKGQYSPQNQDDMFLAYDGNTCVGLFLVSDGVSISEYGSGDIASACVREESMLTWQRIRDGGLTEGAERSDVFDRPAMRGDHETRREHLLKMLDASNGRIGRKLHESMPRFPGPPVGIMAATAVMALVDGNLGTLSSIGDSRIYLVRDGHIVSLMIDHDLATQLLRFGRSPSMVRQVPSGGSLVRCVGEFEKADEDRLSPVPLQPEFRELTLLPGDTLILCSDGIPDYGGVDEEEAEDNIRKAVESAPGAVWAAFELMVLANRGGGGDNISCVVIQFGPPLATSQDDTPVGVPEENHP